MLEDQLTHDERLRLECLAQAIASTGSIVTRNDIMIVINRARVFEEFVRESTEAAEVPEKCRPEDTIDYAEKIAIPKLISETGLVSGDPNGPLNYEPK